MTKRAEVSMYQATSGGGMTGVITLILDLDGGSEQVALNCGC